MRVWNPPIWLLLVEDDGHREGSGGASMNEGEYANDVVGMSDALIEVDRDSFTTRMWLTQVVRA